MSNILAIGDRLHSSWSLRGWLMFVKFGIDVKVRHARMYSDAFPELLEDFAPAKTVPAALLDGNCVWDSIALAEALAEMHGGLWPKDVAARGFARSLVGEMHSSFGALRGACPMNLRVAFGDFEASREVQADIERIEQLWSMARTRFGSDGPWLFGDYSLADAFYAPVAARIAGYGLNVGREAADYVALHLADQDFRRWRAMGFAENWVQDAYKMELAPVPWPGPEVVQATITRRTDAQNEVCPYSGEPTTDYLEIEGRVFGFCNPFCRDKTLADPMAWPGFRAIY